PCRGNAAGRSEGTLRANIRCPANGLVPGAAVTGDNDWLSASELELPGWFRQQIIKLRAFE
ncbi:hypothetical protein ACC870_37120, partial [Rhizobium ruizarguesonis]